jgi:hypothetical protein
MSNYGNYPYVVMEGLGVKISKEWLKEKGIDDKRYTFKEEKKALTNIKLMLSSIADLERVKDRKLKGFKVVEVGGIDKIKSTNQAFIDELLLLQQEIETNKKLAEYEKLQSEKKK